MPASSEREAIESRWLDLTRVVLPGLAAERHWPVRHDHCFQRILLDAACGGRWFDQVAGRPAYKAIDIEGLACAVGLAQGVADGHEDLPALNRRSLRWRGKHAVRGA